MSEDRVYTISTGMKILYSIFAVVVFGVSLFFFAMIGRQQNSKTALFLFAILFFAGAILIAINIARRKVIISDTSITNINVFIKRELLFSEIKGCRIGQKILTLEPLPGAGRSLIIGNYTDLADSEQLAAWIKENFKDIDAEDVENEQTALLSDATLGATAEDRKMRLTTAKQAAIAYGIGGWVCLGLMFFYDEKWSLILCLIYPLLSVILMLWSKGLIKFFTSPKRSIYPSLFYGFMPGTIGLIAIGAAKYTFFEFNTLWLPAILISVIVFAMVYFADRIRIIEPLKGKPFLILFMSLGYGFGSIMQADCAFDNSGPTIYVAKVLDHRIENGKHTSYLLTLSEWGPMHQEKEEDVGRWIYDNVPIGDSVRVYFRKGKLNAPWYVVHSFAYKGE